MRKDEKTRREGKILISQPRVRGSSSVGIRGEGREGGTKEKESLARKKIKKEGVFIGGGA